MVTPACYTSSETSRRYSRACPPYPLGGYLDRRYPHHHLPSHHDTRISKTMVERDSDDAPRKRIAVAVSSTETHLRDGSSDYGYNVETARAYHARASGGALSPLSSLSYAAPAVMATGGGGADGMAGYRQNSYPGYATTAGGGGSKGYYSAAAVYGGAYPDDGGVAAEYGLGGYPAYATTAHLGGQDLPAEQLYRYGGATTASSKAAAAAAGSVYVDPAEAAAAATYPYGSLVHRPASSSELPNFSLSSMAASLPSSSNNSTASERLPNPDRTLSSSSSAYRNCDGLPPSSAGGASGSPYTSKASSSSAGGTDVGTYGDLDALASYGAGAPPPPPPPPPSSSSATTTLSGRSASSGQYHHAAATADYGTAADHVGSYRAAAAHGTGIYSYTDSSSSSSKMPGSSPCSSRRDSHPGSSALANGQQYVPESAAHSHHDPHHHAAAASYHGHHHGYHDQSPPHHHRHRTQHH